MIFCKHYSVTLLLLLSTSCVISAQSPGGVSSPALWLQGDFGVPEHPVGSLNFHPTLVFNGRQDSLKISHALDDLSQATVFTVYQYPPEQDESPVWAMRGPSGDIRLSTRYISSTGNNNRLEINPGTTAKLPAEVPVSCINTYTRQVKNPKTANVPIEQSIVLGSGSFSGTIAELIVYEQRLKPEEITAVESALALKYGITLQKNYVNSRGKTIWDLAANKSFNHNIAAVARDVQGALLQKQGSSCTDPSRLTIGLNRIAATNDTNIGDIPDQQYLIWGDNDAEFTFNPARPDGLQLMRRQWLIKCSGKPASQLSTELQIDIRSFTRQDFPLNRFCLLVNPSGYGSLSAENIRMYRPDSITPGGVACFRNILWDRDGSGTDLFGFALKSEDSDSGQLLTWRNEAADSLKSIVELFPNPAPDGCFRIEFGAGDPPSNITIRVFDQSGRLVFTETKPGRQPRQLPVCIEGSAGLYTVRVQAGGIETVRQIALHRRN